MDRKRDKDDPDDNGDDPTKKKKKIEPEDSTSDDSSSDSSDSDDGYRKKIHDNKAENPDESKQAKESHKEGKKDESKAKIKARQSFKALFDHKHGHATRKVIKSFCKPNKVKPCFYYNKGECRRAKKNELTQHYIKGVKVTDCCRDCYQLAGLINSHVPDTPECECTKL